MFVSCDEREKIRDEFMKLIIPRFKSNMNYLFFHRNLTKTEKFVLKEYGYSVENYGNEYRFIDESNKRIYSKINFNRNFRGHGDE